MNEKVDSYEINEALAKKHRKEVFLIEVKNGPTGVATGQLLQFDAIAIYKNWTRPQIRGYEIKVSRSDFLRDVKYSKYLKHFNEFYFYRAKWTNTKAGSGRKHRTNVVQPGKREHNHKKKGCLPGN